MLFGIQMLSKGFGFVLRHSPVDLCFLLLGCSQTLVRTADEL